MCRCCQSCWEDFYWNCIEERFCYDETIAHYDPDEDEYVTQKKSANGFYSTNDSMENNNAPICRQPTSLARNMSMSSKIHEDDLRREIQTNVPMLAPEVLAVFANSQIFQEHPPPKPVTTKSPASVKFDLASDSQSITETISSTSLAKPDSENKREGDSNKLLQRLEGSEQDIQDGHPVPASIPEIVEEDNEGEVVLRPPRNLIEASSSFSGSTGIINKNISHLQAEQPFFSIRPASENDIFTISTASNYNAISMTPEVPAISFSNLPKNYLETPTVEKYRESVSLYSIQTAGIRSVKEDYSMPRYYRKSDMIVKAEKDNSALQLEDTNLSTSSIPLTPSPAKQVEKSKRLKNIRTALPPLNLQLIRGSSSANLREKEKEAKEKEKLKQKDSIRL